MNYEYRINGETHSVTLDKSDNCYHLSVGDQSLPLHVSRIDDNSLMLSTNGVNKIVHFAKTNGKIFVHLDGAVHILEDVLAEEAAGGSATEIVDGVQKILAPMPGKLVKVCVAEGDKVASGTTVCIVEAMKMENVVQAKLDGIAKKIAFKTGDLVDTETPILEIVAEE
jgi:3-methylcrotonyl-CoA carboxylase alpha subunit